MFAKSLSPHVAPDRGVERGLAWISLECLGWLQRVIYTLQSL